MTETDSLIQELESTGRDIFWQGKASSSSIERLEASLHIRLPLSFRRFLAEYGGGGLVGEEISGIEDDDPSLEYRGTVYGDTIQFRADHGLPLHLVVIYLGSDDIAWCLDTDAFMEGECAVVSFDVFTKATKRLAGTFEDFLKEYLRLRITRG